MAMTGTKDMHPVKLGAPVVDYATGMTGAFALSAALFQRESTGRGQRIDMAMLDVAMILMSSHVTGYLRNGVHPKPHGNRHPHATNGAFETKAGVVMLGASNLRQQRRLWTVLERPDMIKRTNDERDADHAREIAVLEEIMRTRTADEWEEFLQARHVPAARVRSMGEAIADPQQASRGVIHRHDRGNGMEGAFSVPVAAFKFAHGGPRIDTPPPTLGQHNDEVFAELGYGKAEGERGVITLITEEPTDGQVHLGSHPFADDESGGDRSVVRTHARRRGDPHHAAGGAAHRPQARRRQYLHCSGDRWRRRQPAAETPYQGLDHFGLTVTGIDAIAADLKAKGVEFTREPTTVRPGVRVCFIRAPEGVSIELLERTPGLIARCPSEAFTARVVV